MKEFITDLFQKTQTAKQKLLQHSADIEIFLSYISHNIPAGNNYIIKPDNTTNEYYELGNFKITSKNTFNETETIVWSKTTVQPNGYGIIDNINTSEYYFSIKPGIYFISSEATVMPDTVATSTMNYEFRYELINGDKNFYAQTLEGALAPNQRLNSHFYNSNIILIENNNQTFIKFTPYVNSAIDLRSYIKFHLVPLVLN